MSEPRSATPRARKLAPSRIVAIDSSTVTTMRSLVTSHENCPPGSSRIAKRDFMSGISIANFDNDSSSINADSLRSTNEIRRLSDASMTPNSATMSAISSISAVDNLSGGDATSSSSASMMRSISIWSVLTANTRRSVDTFSSLSLILSPNATRESKELRPCVIMASRAFCASLNALSLSCTSSIKRKTRASRASRFTLGFGNGCNASTIPTSSTLRPLIRAHTPLEYCATF
mmetsp:Transcript_4349/g.15944  ORF Transcript_4349/g.15944 Transcript_4349/m.15944 type:complete len:232 (-) Transcript_4349:963-1658(-)